MARLRTKLAELLLARSPDAAATRVARARRSLLIVASVVLAVLFLDIRLESFELSGVEVTVHEEWRFQFLLLVLDVYFLVNYYVVALAQTPAGPRQASLVPVPPRSRLAAMMETVHAYLPFLLGYGAAAWLIAGLAS